MLLLSLHLIFKNLYYEYKQWETEPDSSYTEVLYAFKLYNIFIPHNKIVFILFIRLLVEVLADQVLTG